jgi:hypothetical protein
MDKKKKRKGKKGKGKSGKGTSGKGASGKGATRVASVQKGRSTAKTNKSGAVTRTYSAAEGGGR